MGDGILQSTGRHVNLWPRQSPALRELPKLYAAPSRHDFGGVRLLNSAT